jgi:hypothetical protein
VTNDSSLILSTDERLVLFDLLSGLLDDRKAAGLLRSVAGHDAEIWALNALLSQLERAVTASFSPDYRASVEAARSSLLANNGGPWPGR